MWELPGQSMKETSQLLRDSTLLKQWDPLLEIMCDCAIIELSLMDYFSGWDIWGKSNQQKESSCIEKMDKDGSPECSLLVSVTLRLN